LIKHPETDMSQPELKPRASTRGGKYSTKEIASQLIAYYSEPLQFPIFLNISRIIIHLSNSLLRRYIAKNSRYGTGRPKHPKISKEYLVLSQNNPGLCENF
jgi:hypothetical protein